MIDTGLLLPILVMFVAMLYSSVGHGGASGYLAVLSLLGYPTSQMASTALVLNLLVSGLASASYIKAKHFSWRLTWPFIITSIPASLAGGLMHISNHTYYLLLALILIVSALRLATTISNKQAEIQCKDVPLPIALTSGAGIGLLSGLVGIGGGIFLSPLMLLFNWANAKQTSATSALFIFVNSLAGLAGRALRGAVDTGTMMPLVVASFLGGALGSYYGANIFSGAVLRRLLAVVLFLAAIKLILAL